MVREYVIILGCFFFILGIEGYNELTSYDSLQSVKYIFQYITIFFSRRAMALILDDALAASFIVRFDRGSQPANKFFILFLASNKLA